MKIRHILTILAVKDLEKSRRFYDSAFGWPTEVEVPVYVEYRLPEGQRLGLYRQEAFAANTGKLPIVSQPGQITATELYFHTDNLTEAIERVEAAGAILLSPLAKRDWGDEAAYFADPDGNVLVLARELDEK